MADMFPLKKSNQTRINCRHFDPMLNNPHSFLYCTIRIALDWISSFVDCCRSDSMMDKECSNLGHWVDRIQIDIGHSFKQFEDNCCIEEHMDSTIHHLSNTVASIADKSWVQDKDHMLAYKPSIIQHQIDKYPQCIQYMHHYCYTVCNQLEGIADICLHSNRKQVNIEYIPLNYILNNMIGILCMLLGQINSNQVNMFGKFVSKGSCHNFALGMAGMCQRIKCSLLCIVYSLCCWCCRQNKEYYILNNSLDYLHNNQHYTANRHPQPHNNNTAPHIAYILHYLVTNIQHCTNYNYCSQCIPHRHWHKANIDKYIDQDRNQWSMKHIGQQNYKVYNLIDDMNQINSRCLLIDSM